MLSLQTAFHHAEWAKVSETILGGVIGIAATLTDFLGRWAFQ